MPLPGDIRLVSSIDRPTEAVIVIAAAFGSAIVRSTIYAAYVWTRPAGTVVSMPFSTEAMQHLLAEQLPTFLLLLFFLWVRGWTPQRLGLVLGWRWTLAGLALGAATYIACWAVEAAVHWVSTRVWHQAVAVRIENQGLTLPTIATSSIMNGTYEETFLCGYLLNFAQTPHWRRIAATVSMLVRLSYHTYQGPLGLLNALLFGTMMTVFALRTRKLWQPVVAHICADIAGLLTLPARS